jgi:hypothetical protein
VDDEGYDQTVEGDELRFRGARDGDHLMCPFQCDLCHFRNIQRRNPVPGLPKDKLLLQCTIQRASVDAFWSREASTVNANARGAKRLQEIGVSLGILAVCPPMGPFALEDTAGMAMAVSILLRSLYPGRTEDTIQFSTARYLRSVFSNVYHASAEHQTGMAVMAQGTSKTYVTNCPSYGYWFERFMQGVHKRMGEEVRSDYALSVKALHKILGNLDARWRTAAVAPRRKEVVEIAFFLVLTFCLGLRGEEVVKLDITGFLSYFENGENHLDHPHVMVPLQPGSL